MENKPKFEIGEFVKKKKGKKVFIVKEIRGFNQNIYVLYEEDGKTIHPYWCYEKELERVSKK